MPHEITSIWSASIESNVSGQYVIKNTGDNQDIKAKESVNLALQHHMKRRLLVIGKMDIMVISHDDNHYIVKNAGHNANIGPGQAISLGFDGNPGKVTEDIKNIKIKHVSTSLEELNRDADEDGIDDYTEIMLGLDPLVADTDGDEKIEQTLAENIECEESPEITEVSVSMNGTGLIDETTKIKNTFGIDRMTSDVVGLVGIPVEYFDICYIVDRS